MSTLGPAPYRAAVRRAFGRALAGHSTMLALLDYGLSMVLKGDQVGALTENERKNLRRVRADIQQPRKTLALLAKRIERETQDR